MKNIAPFRLILNNIECHVVSDDISFCHVFALCQIRGSYPRLINIYDSYLVAKQRKDYYSSCYPSNNYVIVHVSVSNTVEL